MEICKVFYFYLENKSKSSLGYQLNCFCYGSLILRLWKEKSQNKQCLSATYNFLMIHSSHLRLNDTLWLLNRLLKHNIIKLTLKFFTDLYNILYQWDQPLLFFWSCFLPLTWLASLSMLFLDFGRAYAICTWK